MPIVFLIVGILLVVTGVKGSPTQLYTLVLNDVKGSGTQKGFVYWAIAIAILGGLGYIKSLQKLSREFMVLVLLVLLLHNQTGFFAQLKTEFNKLVPSSSSTGTAATGS
jgi:hypothetical protein